MVDGLFAVFGLLGVATYVQATRRWDQVASAQERQDYDIADHERRLVKVEAHRPPAWYGTTPTIADHRARPLHLRRKETTVNYRDIVFKTAWTAAAAALGYVVVALTGRPEWWAVVAIPAVNAALAWARQKAGATPASAA
jgi:hypothetical protein